MHADRRLVFDPYDYALQDDPYPTYRRLRDEEPLHHNEEHDFWVLSRHADVHRGGAHRRGVQQPDGRHPRRERLDAARAHDDVVPRHGPARADPAAQAGLARASRPRRVAGLEPQIQRITDRYLDAVPASRGSFDWVADLAGKVPMDVISEMLGVPEADRDEVRRLADLLVHREPGLRDVPPVGIEAAMSCSATTPTCSRRSGAARPTT